MEITSLSGITSTTGKVTGTRYPSLRSTRIVKNKTSLLVSGSWSHVKRALANDELYNQRVKIFRDWFSVWDSPQRCKFFLDFLRQCSSSELMYIEGWFIQRSPVLRQDFTNVLPRWLSLYIFSFLDPKSLCRASQVSSHWQFLTEQDAVWMPKCVRLGWFLPAVPSRKEYGAWKTHYINSVNTLDYRVLAYDVYQSARPTERPMQLSRQSSHRAVMSSPEFVSSRGISPVPSNGSMDIVHEQSPRPMWQHTSKSPRILEKDHLATLDKMPRYSKTDDVDTTGLHRRSKSVPAKLVGSTALRKSNRERKSLMDQSSSLPVHGSSFYKEISIQTRSMDEMTKLSETTLNFDRTEIRRKVPRSSSSLIHTQRSFECKSFSAPLSNEILTMNMNNMASDNPVVLFVSSRLPAREVLVDCVLFGVISIPYDYEGETLDSLLIKLKNRLAGRLAARIGFCVDGNKVEGTANIIGGATLSLASVKHEKMQDFWKRVSLHLKDEEDVCIDLFWPLASTENGLETVESLMKLTGAQFSTPIGFTGSLTRMETEWLREDNGIKTPHYYFKKDCINFWINYCDYLEDTLRTLRQSFKRFLMSENRKLLDHIIGDLAGKLLKIADSAAVERLCSSIASVCSSNFLDSSDEKVTARLKNITDIINGKSSESDHGFGGENRGISSMIESHVDQRTRCAHEIYDLELEYKSKLNLLKEIYVQPLTSSLKSNRAIISAANMKIIFNDCETLEKISSDLVNNIKNRINSWNADQCLGDVYLQFTTNLKAYYNFLRNYPTALRTLERCIEENPVFRAFLKRQRNNIESQNLSIPDLLLLSTRINQRRLDSLSSLLKCTPKEHQDRSFLSTTLKKIREITESINQTKERFIKEEVFLGLQDRIKNCPPLNVEGRYLIKEMPLLQLSVENGSKSQLNGGVHLHIRDVTLFLFNDMIMYTRRCSRLKPFCSTIQEELRYETQESPQKLRAVDVPDTKYFSNAFRLSMKHNEWLLQASSQEDKLSYLSLFSELYQ